MTTGWYVLFLFLIIDLAFSVVRTALIYTRMPYLMNFHEKNPSGVDRAIRLLEIPSLRVTLNGVGIFIHFLLAGSVIYLSTTNFTNIPELYISIFFLFLASVLILGLEFAVQGWVERRIEEWAIWVAPIGFLLYYFFRPVSWIFQQMQFSPGRNLHSKGSVTEDDLKNWVQEGQNEGTLEQGERKMIYSIFHFNDTLCREIMVPRIDVSSLEADISLEEAVRLLTSSGHSRVPVFDDVIDNILGVVYAKDLLGARLDNDQQDTVRSLMRPAYFVPEAKRVGELLKEMQARGVHIAIVIDEYGGMAGLVTLEDIVEEIVGEIRDEYDQSEEQLYTQTGTQEFTFQGRIDLDDLNEILDTHLTKEIADTLGGLIYSEVGRIPVEGEQIEIEEWILRVEKVTGRRIRQVKVSKRHQENEKENNNGAE